MLLKSLRIFLTAFLIVIGAGGSAQALLDKGEHSEEEKIGFAFYKLGGIKPDFNSWVEHTDAYANTLPAEKRQVLQDETLRLEQGFHNYQPDEDLIVVKSPVYVDVTDFASPDPAYAKLGVKKRSVISMPGMPAAYLPFLIINTWVAVVPQNYSQFTNLFLTEEQFKKLRETMGFRASFEKIRFQGEIELVLRPVNVDTHKPIKIDDKEMWLMGAEIASMTIWNQKKNKVIWEYSAPWFVTSNSKQLLNLYGE